MPSGHTHRSIRKYPRTPHLEGSRVQPGDEDLESVPLEVLPPGIATDRSRHPDGALSAATLRYSPS